MLDGKNIKADIKVDAPDLGRNMKELAGAPASGFVTIGGTLSEPVAKADLTATGLRYGDDVRLEAPTLRGDISAKPSGEVGGSTTSTPRTAPSPRASSFMTSSLGSRAPTESTSSR